MDFGGLNELKSWKKIIKMFSVILIYVYVQENAQWLRAILCLRNIYFKFTKN